MKKMMKGIAITLLLLATVALLVTPVAAAQRDATNKVVPNGGTIFLDEICLNLSSWSGDADKLVYYTSVTDKAVGKAISVANFSCFDVDPVRYGLTDYVGKIFYAVNASDVSFGNVYLDKAAVTIDLVLNISRKDSVNGKSITRDTLVDVKVVNNIADVMSVGGTNAVVQVEFTTPDGGKRQIFAGLNGTAVNLSLATLYLGPLSLDDPDVRPGQYSVLAKWPGTSDFYAKGYDSNTGTFTLLTKAISIATNKDSLVRGNNFVITITGEAKKMYYVYVKDAGVALPDTYPTILAGQSNVVITDPDVVDMCFNNDPNDCVDDHAGWDNTQANVTTNAAGSRTIEFTTTQTTKDRSFTIKVVDPLDKTKYDEVKVAIQKGAVSVDASGTKTYFVGEEVRFFGTNTDSDFVYLFIVGPNLPAAGGKLDDPRTPVENDDENTFVIVDVESDDTWEYKWDTTQIGLDAGTYTIYAVSLAKDKDHLSDAEYDTVSIVLKKPFVNATLPATRVAKGDEIKITGTAEGKPDQGVAIWVLGKNFYKYGTEAVEDDLSFEYTLERGDTQAMTSGQYFVVVQHPMYNGNLDIHPIGPDADCDRADQICVVNDVQWMIEFVVQGPGALMGSDAAEALTKVLDKPNVDDTYMKLYFLLEEPWINIAAVSDKTVGDKFTLTGTTNLAVDDTLQITVTSASFKPTEKTQAGEFSGVAGSVKVAKGTGVDNVWSFDVDTAGFKPDQYIVEVECIETDTRTTTTFFVTEFKPTPVPTTVVTPVATTPVKTTVTTPVATPTTTPGFGAVIALIGLGAVAVLVLRRH